LFAAGDAPAEKREPPGSQRPGEQSPKQKTGVESMAGQIKTILFCSARGPAVRGAQLAKEPAAGCARRCTKSQGSNIASTQKHLDSDLQGDVPAGERDSLESLRPGVRATTTLGGPKIGLRRASPPASPSAAAPVASAAPGYLPRQVRKLTSYPIADHYIGLQRASQGSVACCGDCSAPAGG